MNTYVTVVERPNIIWINSNLINDRINSNHYKKIMLSNLENISKCGLNVLKIKDIVKVNRRGKGLNKIVYGEIPNYKVRNLTNFGIDKEPDYIMKEDFTKNKLCNIKKGDVLLASTGVGSLGKVDLFYNDILATVDGHITILRTKDNYDSGYLKSYLQSKYGQIMIEQNTLGSTGQTEIYPKDIEEFLIPIPSPEIQKYIGDKVRKSEELREKAKKLYALCEERIKNLFNIKDDELLFNNNAGNVSLEYSNYPIINLVKTKEINNRIDPKAYHPELYNTLKQLQKLGIETIELKKSLCNYATGKSSPVYSESGTPIIMTKNIRNSYIDWDCKYVSEMSVKKDDLIEMEDVLITIYGGPSIGKVDIKSEEIECISDYTIMRMRFEKSCNPYFMTLLLRSKYIQNQLRYIIKGTTGITFVIPNEVLNILIPVIDIDIQNEIGSLFKNSLNFIRMSKQLIQEAKQDVEDLIEGIFDTSKVRVDG